MIFTEEDIESGKAISMFYRSYPHILYIPKKYHIHIDTKLEHKDFEKLPFPFLYKTIIPIMAARLNSKIIYI